MQKKITPYRFRSEFNLLNVKHIIASFSYSRHLFPYFIACMMTFLLIGCSPRIEVAPPTAPITINLNVKIDHEIHINVDKQVESLIASSPELFE